MAVGLQADVTVVDKSVGALRRLSARFGNSLKTAYSTTEAVDSLVTGADLVIGSVLIPGAIAPRLVTRDMVTRMNRGAAMVDISIDQGGCFETSKPTTHADPTYIVNDVVHYCVTNMPGAVPRTSALALNNATLPFVMALANRGYNSAIADDPHLAQGVNVYEGEILLEAVAREMRVA